MVFNFSSEQNLKKVAKAKVEILLLSKIEKSEYNLRTYLKIYYS
jgi:hypothetical protein